jgi:glycosyltransferase involved in cell wall biosynthesis
MLGLTVPSGAVHSIDKAKPEVALPLVDLNLPRSPAIGWIPDFQHRYLPELFAEDERRRLEIRHEKLAEKCRLMWCSSESVAQDFRKFFPRLAHKARVASFPSLFAYEPPGETEAGRSLPYRLGKRFLLVINQFWAHKNHKLVADALGVLRQAGLEIPTVIAGLPADYRDKQNTALSETLQTLANNGSWPHCLVLGKVGRDELLLLLRSATALVQPSRFEGWNTTVEDAKALGCPVILSDLEVHREQCPDALGFFGCDDPRALAAIIANNWKLLPARPDRKRELECLEQARLRGLEFGSRLAAICAEAAR